MGAVAAAVSKAGKNVVPKVVAMLKELAHRGSDAHGVAAPGSAAFAGSIEEVAVEKVVSSVALGYNLSRVLPWDRPQPVLGKGFALVFEGRVFPGLGVPEVDEAAERLKVDPYKGAEGVIEGLDGSYAFAVACPGKLICGRDSLGTTPFYYGESESLCAVASEHKALWALGIKSVRSFPPGSLAVINSHGFSFRPIKPVTQPPLESVEMEMAAEVLRGLLLQSTGERVEGVERVAVAFSGGLDSSLVAVLAEACGADVHLVSVGLEGQPEVQHAEAAAEALGLPLHLQTYGVDMVERVLSRVLWLIEEPDVMKVGVAVPLYWAAEEASKAGCSVLLAGQLGDELFGGYHRYLQRYVQGGAAAVREAMYLDVLSSYERNFQRDDPVCSFHGVELRLPFADREVVNYSLGLPVGLNIESGRDRLRKRVLRRVAQKLSMPRFIVNRAKKAVQYATGVDKAIQRLARNRGLTPREYLEKTFKGVYGKA